MRNPIPVMSAHSQMLTRGHVYVPTTGPYSPRDNDVSGDKSNSSGPTQGDGLPRRPAQSEVMKDGAPRTPWASAKAWRD